MKKGFIIVLISLQGFLFACTKYDYERPVLKKDFFIEEENRFIENDTGYIIIKITLTINYDHPPTLEDLPSSGGFLILSNTNAEYDTIKISLQHRNIESSYSGYLERFSYLNNYITYTSNDSSLITRAYLITSDSHKMYSNTLLFDSLYASF